MLDLDKKKFAVCKTYKRDRRKGKERRVRFVDVSTDESLCIIGMNSGHMLLYDFELGADMMVEPFFESEVTCAKWNEQNSALVICYGSGEIILVDRRLHIIGFIFENGHFCSSVNLRELFGNEEKDIKAVQIEWASSSTTISHNSSGIGPFVLSKASSKAELDNKSDACSFDGICIVTNGPVIVMRIELPASAKGLLTNSLILNGRLSNFQIIEALELICSLSSNSEFYLCFSHLVEYLLKAGDMDSIEYLGHVFNTCWPKFLEVKTKYLPSAVNLYIRYFNRLLREDRFEDAFRAAVHIDLPEIFLQLLNRCKDENIITEMVVNKLKELYDVDLLLDPPDFPTDQLKIEDFGVFQLLATGYQKEAQGRREESAQFLERNNFPEEATRILNLHRFLKGDS
eukprot:TRINITY_DN14829_c0_g1_i1.p1 TRINITY_DN14829_c0_g1~~TRINITY_DN14829_c0_g1_i1.p1  ORF type:complete len:400 (+),score=91.99 TRINITY_DN14829_c0_g1_i1:163-1362(+)